MIQIQPGSINEFAAWVIYWLGIVGAAGLATGLMRFCKEITQWEAKIRWAVYITLVLTLAWLALALVSPPRTILNPEDLVLPFFMNGAGWITNLIVGKVSARIDLMLKLLGKLPIESECHKFIPDLDKQLENGKVWSKVLLQWHRSQKFLLLLGVLNMGANNIHRQQVVSAQKDSLMALEQQRTQRTLSKAANQDQEKARAIIANQERVLAYLLEIDKGNKLRGKDAARIKKMIRGMNDEVKRGRTQLQMLPPRVPQSFQPKLPEVKQPQQPNRGRNKTQFWGRADYEVDSLGYYDEDWRER